MVKTCRECHLPKTTCNELGYCLSCRVNNNFPKWMIDPYCPKPLLVPAVPDKREKYIEDEVRQYFSGRAMTNEQIKMIVEFVRDNCFCDNCECNAPRYPWN